MPGENYLLKVQCLKCENKLFVLDAYNQARPVLQTVSVLLISFYNVVVCASVNRGILR